MPDNFTKTGNSRLSGEDEDGSRGQLGESLDLSIGKGSLITLTNDALQGLVEYILSARCRKQAADRSAFPSGVRAMITNPRAGIWIAAAAALLLLGAGLFIAGLAYIGWLPVGNELVRDVIIDYLNSNGTNSPQ